MKSPAAAAAKINADLQARRGIQHVDVPPIRSVSIDHRHNLNDALGTDPDPIIQTQSPVPKAASPSSGQSTSKLETDIYQQDGDYIKDIEVNDLRNRYTLTKGPTQKMVNILDASAH